MSIMSFIPINETSVTASTMRSRFRMMVSIFVGGKTAGRALASAIAADFVSSNIARDRTPITTT
jgi:hypothetical protein